MSDTIERIKKVTAEILKKDAAGIGDDAQFTEDLGASSLQSVELVAALEEEFDIEMDQDDALQVTSVSAAAAFIDKLLERD